MKIKRYLTIIIVLLITLLVSLISNGTQEIQKANYELFTVDRIKEGYHLFTNKDENFIVNTYISKLSFEENEEIDIFSTLEYIGKKKSVQIWSVGHSYFNHNIFDGSINYHKNIVLTILTTTRLIKGETYILPFIKEGSYTDDPKDEFWKKYYTEKELKLPSGNYTFTASTGFSLDEDLKEHVNLENKFKVSVQ
ncbi:hypothetical protein BHU72_01570 [Desulfuribacillus stibiiarsenatis]|uniref:Uncharacterized protein n=1 Tax=Desulfuribacillus stibiiarsenatis TaxID=1390249 RepID=A0A1E5LAE8_9FIRM|nr:hypothetical protein BHU72_01570 [Desulfuribacillus stibiiarsenatis]